MLSGGALAEELRRMSDVVSGGAFVEALQRMRTAGMPCLAVVL